MSKATGIVTIDGEQYKECSKCGATKKIPNDFGKNRSKPGGFEYYCKACIREYHKNYRETGTGKLSSKPKKDKKNGLDYFTKLGLTSFIDGFSKVFDKAKNEYLCGVSNPYREHLSKLFKEVFDKGIVPVIQSHVPPHVQLQEEIKKLREQLLTRDEIIRKKDSILESDKEQIQDLYGKLGEVPKQRK